MLRSLIVAGIAAIAGRQLYKSGALDRFGTSVKDRAEVLKRHVDDRRLGHKASLEAAGGPGGGIVLPPSLRKQPGA